MKGIGMKNFSGYTVVAALLATATLAGCPKPELHSQVLDGTNKLKQSQVYFVPVEDAKRLGFGDYARLVRPTVQLVDNTTHEVVLNAAGPASIVEKLDEPVLFFGEFYDSLKIAKNGTVVLFNDADTTDPLAGENATAEGHFKSRQVSLLPVAATGVVGDAEVTLFQNSVEVIVTYSSIMVGASADNAFQVVFVKSRGIDGDIAINYDVTSGTGTAGVIGVSNAQLFGKSPDEITSFLGAFGTGSILTEQSANTKAIN